MKTNSSNLRESYFQESYLYCKRTFTTDVYDATQKFFPSFHESTMDKYRDRVEIGSRLGQPSIDFSKVFICLRQKFCSGNLEQKVQVYLVRVVRATSASVLSCFERSGPISRKVEISSLIFFST